MHEKQPALENLYVVAPDMDEVVAHAEQTAARIRDEKLYEENRPYVDANGSVHDPADGKFVNPDRYFDQQREIHEENAQTAYEDMGMLELARKLAEAEVHNDRTSMRNINDALLDKMIDHAGDMNSAEAYNMLKGGKDDTGVNRPNAVEMEIDPEAALVDRIMNYKDSYKAKLLAPEKVDNGVLPGASAQEHSDVDAEPVEYGPERPSDIQLIRSRKLRNARAETEVIDSIDPEKLDIFKASGKFAHEQRKPSAIVEDALANKIEQALDAQTSDEAPYDQIVDASDKIRERIHDQLDDQDVPAVTPVQDVEDGSDESELSPAEREQPEETPDIETYRSLPWRERMKYWFGKKTDALNAKGVYFISGAWRMEDANDMRKERKRAIIGAGVLAVGAVLAYKGLIDHDHANQAVDTHKGITGGAGTPDIAGHHFERTHLGELFNLEGGSVDSGRLQLVHEQANNMVTLQTADGTIIAEHLHLGHHGLTPDALQHIHDAGYDTEWNPLADNGKGTLRIFKK